MNPALLFCLTLLCALGAGRVPAAEPVRVIFETDMGNDVDDVLALDMLYKYREAGLVDLLLVSNNKGDAFSVPFIRLMNAFYGHADIPVASSPDTLLPVQPKKHPPYTEVVVRSGEFAVPDGPAGDAVDRYRATLAAQPDRSVVIVSVGFSSNLARLLASPPDRHSDLAGCELVARKVRLLTMMAGNFDGAGRREFNVRIDIPAACAVFTRWPSDILVSPWEVGGSIFYRSPALDGIDYAAPHPLKRAYAAYLPMPYDRECWDQTAVLAGIEDPRRWFSLSPRGEVTVDDLGRTTFTPAPAGRIRLLETTPRQRRRIARRITQLVGRTPRRYAADR